MHPAVIAVRRIRGQDGYVVPMTMVALLIALLLLGASMLRAQGATDTARRDADSRRALQAADAGLRMAVYQLNGLALDLSPVLNLGQQCIVSVGGALSFLPISGSWCTPVTGTLSGGASYSYQLSPAVNLSVGGLLSGITNTLERQVLATGTVGGVTRRVYMKVGAQGGKQGLLSFLVTLLSDANLRVYEPIAASYRECGSSPPSGSNPALNCT